MTWILAALALLWIALGPWVLVVAAALLLVPRVRWWVQDRVVVTRRWVARCVVVGLALAALVVVVPDGWLPIPQSPGVLAVPSYVGRPADDRPVAAEAVAEHPHLAARGRGSSHADGWATDAYPWGGPLGLQPEVETAWFGLEQCGSTAFEPHDRLVVRCTAGSEQALHVVDPETMHKLASKDLPERPEDEPGEVCTQASLLLDPAGRALVPTADRRLMVVRTADGSGEPDLSTDQVWDLQPHVPPGDCLVAAAPDWAGTVWWASAAGLVGTVVPATGEVRVVDLGEPVANGFAVDETGGVYVVTDAALHRLTAAPDGTPVVSWRTEYDRGSEQRSGQLSQGSGTTPTIIDHGIIAIADNADSRVHVVFLDRETGRELCREPVFADEESATEASLVSVGSGVVATNNHGATSRLGTVLGRAPAPGLARVDLVKGECRTRWTNDTVASTGAPAASWASGLVYAVAKRPTWTGVSAWYLTAVDVTTGRAMWAVRVGTGALSGSRHGSVALGPDRSAWVTTYAGLVRVRDRD